MVTVDTSRFQAKMARLNQTVGGLQSKVIAGLAFQLEREMKIEAPVRTGRLRNSIEALIEIDKATVGTSVEYAKWVAFPTKPHSITPKTKEALAWPGGPGPRKSVFHPGTKGNPFHLRAAAKVKGDAQEIAETIIDRELAGV